MSAASARCTRFAPGALYLLLAMPFARTWLESTMAVHMLVQLPLLAAIGVAACRSLLPESWQERALAWAGGPAAWVLVAFFASSYWMLPRALDAALADPLVETAKFLGLPALIGLPFALAWKRLSVIGRGFVWTNFSSMLAVLGWLYLAAPQRVCNSYPVNQQESAGRLMIELAVLLFCGWLVTLFIATQPAHGRADRDRRRGKYRVWSEPDRAPGEPRRDDGGKDPNVPCGVHRG